MHSASKAHIFHIPHSTFHIPHSIMACKTITVRKRAGRQYLIHYAGGASFVVRVFGKVLTVYTSQYSNSSDITAGKQVHRATIKKLFVPSSLKPGVKRTLQGKSLKDVCDIGLAGNSLLAQISNDTSTNDGFKYLYIGHDVVEVTLDEPVEQYYSELVSGFASNPYLKVAADAPLAYAITKNYVYFFHTMTRFDRDAFPSLRDVVPPLNPAADYSPAVKSAMRKTAKRIIKKVLVPFTTY